MNYSKMNCPVSCKKKLEEDKTSLGDKCTNAEKELMDTKEVLNALNSDHVSTKKLLEGKYVCVCTS